MKHGSYCNMVWVVVVVVVFLNVSCRPDETCRQSMETGLCCTFSEAYLDDTKQVKYITSWDSLTVRGMGKAEALYDNTRSVQSILLPLRQDQDSTCYTLCYHQMTDTVVIYHTNRENFVSVECGCTYEHELLNIRHTEHWIDSIAVLQTTINRDKETNIRFMRER